MGIEHGGIEMPNNGGQCSENGFIKVDDQRDLQESFGQKTHEKNVKPEEDTGDDSSGDAAHPFLQNDRNRQ